MTSMGVRGASMRAKDPRKLGPLVKRAIGSQKR